MELTWTKVIVGGFALASAVAAGTWELRRDRLSELQSRIDFYEKADHWEFPELVKSLNEANKSIEANIASLADYESVKVENKKLKENIIESEKKLSAIQQQLEESKNEVEEIKRELASKVKFIEDLYPHNETFTITEKARKNLAGYSLIIGLADVSSQYVELIYNNEDKRLYPGNFIASEHQGNLCKLVLDSIQWTGSPEKATFTFFCLSKSNKSSNSDAASSAGS